MDSWLVTHATSGGDLLGSPTHVTPGGCSGGPGGGSSGTPRTGSGATTPVRKISAHEFEKGGLLKPIVNTIDGTPTFLSTDGVATGSGGPGAGSGGGAGAGGGGTGGAPGRPHRRSRHELRQLDEKELIFELVSKESNAAISRWCIQPCSRIAVKHPPSPPKGGACFLLPFPLYQLFFVKGCCAF